MKTKWVIASDFIAIPQIYAIGFSDDVKVTRHSRAIRNQYIIHYVLSGKGFFNGNIVEKGQGFLIYPDRYSEYRADAREPWSFLWVISEDEKMHRFFERYNACAETGIFQFHNLYALEQSADQIKNATDDFPSSSRLSEFFLHLFHACNAKGETSSAPITKTYFDFSVNYIKSNLHLPLSVGALCDVLGITQPYLYRIFKEFAGCSPKQYILRDKLTQARRLLTQTELSVSQVADAVGFQSVTEFSKFFSSKTALSPTAYREAYLLGKA